MMLVRIGEGLDPGKRSTDVWSHPDDDNLHGRVELFYGNGQVGVSGVHSYRVTRAELIGQMHTLPRFEPAIVYDWFEGPTPFDTRFEDLPEISAKDFASLTEFINSYFDGQGWHRLHTGGEQGSTLRYTLDTGEIFRTDEGEFAYEDLAEGMNVAMASITGEGTKFRRGWTWLYERNDGEQYIAIYDRESCISWLPPQARPRTGTEMREAHMEKMNAIAVALHQQGLAAAAGDPDKRHKRTRTNGRQEGTSA